MPPLNQLRVFECVARHRSFTAAAQELHITQGAVSHQIRALERWLGFKLFVREPGQLRLTGGAAEYAHILGDAFAQVAKGTRELVSASSYMVLSVRGHTTFFMHWLIPRLPAFQKHFPDIKVRLSANVEWVGFDREPADIAIRYGDGDWEGLESHLLFSDELTPVLAPSLARMLPRPCGLDALLALPLLHSNRRPNHWPEWIQAAGGERDLSSDDIHYEDLSIVYECAIQGLGVALGQLRYLDRELSRGELIAPYSYVLRRSRGYHLVYPKGEKCEAKVECFRDWLLSQEDLNSSACAGR